MTETLAPYSMTNDNALMMMFLMNIIGISYVFVMNGAEIVERLKCMFYYESKNTPFNNRTHITNICNALLYMQTFFYSTIISAKFIILNSTYIIEKTLLPLIGTLAILFAGIFLFKRISYYVVNSILFSKQKVVEWRNSYFFTIKLLGFALTPAAVTILFFPDISFDIISFYLLFVLIIYIYTVFKSLIEIIFTQNRKYLDIFLYLCALEFIPMGIACRLIMKVGDF